MDEELLGVLCDAFDPGEFIEFLDVSVRDIVAAFPDEYEEALDDLKEIVGYDDDLLEVDDETDER